MSDNSNWRSNRREFLTATGGLVAATLASAEPLSALAGSPGANPGSATQANSGQSAGANSPRKLLIGVFDPVYNHLSLEQMLEKMSALQLEAVEIGTGGYPGASHCPVQELLADPAKARAWKKKFEDRNIRVGALSCHGNPVHPDAKIAARDAQIFRNTVLLAERLEVPVIVGFSGCPGGSPTDTMPNWATYRWPPEYAQILDWQWKERVIPYWKEAAKFSREHGIRKLAFEMHPGFCVYNPKTLMRLREAVGEEIGANCDLSHLFWQQCDPVEVIRFLGKQGAIYHAHMKDTVLFKDNIAKYGVLNFAFEPKDIPSASAIFRAVGYGHGANLWKDVMRTYMEVGYEGMLSIENEDPILPGEVGVERAAYVLKNVREELLNTNPASA
ncbi:MAG TPA: sugar phosphate isomerase/epimerase [Terriglobales bacterium]|jgi:sugar phosphate isomerase/epimerase|nr:sugar phosphate isomerase/epimerase [Terriglobales bacterium]